MELSYISKLYFDFQDKYEKIYGEKTLCLIQVGSFYEIYGVECANLGNARKIADILNIKCTRKDKTKPESLGNPLMCGFQVSVAYKFLDRLLRDSYTLVLIDHKTKNGQNLMEKKIHNKKCIEVVKRRVTQILSPGTSLDYLQSQDSNYIVSLYITHEQAFPSKKDILAIGMSTIDLSTGKSMIYESIDKLDDTHYALDESLRFLLTFKPKEIIVHNENPEIIKKLNLDNYQSIKRVETKINYQDQFLGKIFPEHKLISAIEYLDLTMLPYATSSYTMLLEYCYQHNETLIEKINKPEIWKKNKYLTLDTNSIDQLDIANKKSSLFNIINKTSTSIGRRLLQHHLTNPITDIQELEKRYNLVEQMLGNEREYENLLRPVVDLERFHRRMKINKLEPYEFEVLHQSNLNIQKILLKLETDFKELIPNHKFNKYIEEYEKIFDFDELSKSSLDNISNSFFNAGIYPEVDELQKEINQVKKYFDDLIEKLSKLIDPSKIVINLNYNDKEGYSLGLTKNRYKLIEKDLKNYEMSRNSGNVKLKSREIKLNSDRLVSLTNKIKFLSQECYFKYLNKLVNKYSDTLEQISLLIARIDVIKSHAKIARLNKYVKPVIVQSDKSFIDIKTLRHPILESIHSDEKFIPNDLTLKSEGNIIFGINGVGKSILMKSVGLAVVMAQIGGYVSADQMNYYPFDNILTRIIGNDNMFRKLSSFAVEMIELRSILNRSGPNSLILADELSKGSESVSGVSLVVATIDHLSRKNSNFICTTHLHQISELDEIKELENVKLKHLAVEFTEDRFVYIRKLQDGPGSSLYGIEVAKTIIPNDDFIKHAYRIRKKLLGLKTEVLSEKVSKYNSNVFLDKCYFCPENKNLDTHHIKFQCTADQDGMIDHYHKNKDFNLVVLCKKHHVEVHQGLIQINEWKTTSDGKVLDYEFVKKIKKKKYQGEDINIINSFKDLPGMTQAKAVRMLKDKHDIKIGKETLKKIWKGTYI